MADPWKSQVVEGHNLCPICKASSTLQIDGETVDVTIDEDEIAHVFEDEVDEDDVVICRNCDTEFEVKTHADD